MKTRTSLLLGGLAVVGWAMSIGLLMRGFNRPQSPPGSWSHPQEPTIEHDHATDEGPPVIRLTDLPPLGFDSADLSRIEPHFHVLNAALVTLVELHTRFQQTASEETRRNAALSSVSFHQTADQHERVIESILEPGLRNKFHVYMLRREAEVGLHPDSAWHAHGSRQSRDPLRLYQHPETIRPDSVKRQR